ncbi:nitrate transporter, putative [Ricinus communis]|uniref:Nitrate transporter, putative n=1 Tax=Ricinus communis TaxID=3988 RepID=B9S2D6_RICCO|nr:nitrate transporter, putative [Ricinus communis]|eukprot:XP_002520155.1 protein NRT1/ PTR FAMILY 2.13 [Ricinus communis]
MEVGEQKKNRSSYELYCFTKCFQNPSTREKEPEEKSGAFLSDDSKIIIAQQKQPGGWRAMPYILGNETFERLATFGLLANFMVYLMKEFHMEQVTAANIINIWSGLTNFAPLLGAFISDAYVGRFRTIAFASCAAFLGMVTVTLTAWLPNLHPQKCHQQSQQQYADNCESATPLQLAVLLMGLGFLSIGTGGIRPCSIPFGVDQFDPTTEEGMKGINSFYNWYYTTFTLVILITLTVVVYIQDSISWVIGFSIPTVLMLCSILLFFIGTKIYIHVKPEGSIFSGLAQVFVAAYKKRRLKLPDHGEVVDGIFYDPTVKEAVLSKLPLTNQFRFLNKAAMIEKNDINPDGSCANEWRLCSIQQIEEVKCLFKIGPIWASGIVSFTAILQQGTFTVSQAMKMDRHLGHKFQIPAGSISVFSMITIAIWLPFYDRIAVPALRKITKHEGGITLLQRIGIGIVFSVLSMIVAGLVERDRRAAAISNPGTPMSVMWLVPQLVIMGLCEAFNIIGHIEFYNKEFPGHMRSMANSLFFCSFAGASYLSTLVISIVHKVTRTRDHPDWLTKDLNAGKLDRYYFVLAGMGILTFFYFLYCARLYQYKTPVQIDNNSYRDVELSLGEKIPSS